MEIRIDRFKFKIELSSEMFMRCHQGGVLVAHAPPGSANPERSISLGRSRWIPFEATVVEDISGTCMLSRIELKVYLHLFICGTSAWTMAKRILKKRTRNGSNWHLIVK